MNELPVCRVHWRCKMRPNGRGLGALPKTFFLHALRLILTQSGYRNEGTAALTMGVLVVKPHLHLKMSYKLVVTIKSCSC